MQNSSNGDTASSDGQEENLGVGAITPSFGAYFKTSSSNGEPASDHTGFFENGVISSVGPSPVPINSENDNVENGKWHRVSMEWDSDSQELKVYYEGELRQTIQKIL